jgi:hypothetical protein
MKRRILSLLALDLLFIQVSSVFAGGPIIISETGVPYVWNNSSAIPYNPDQGNLGTLDNNAAKALVANAFAAWSNVSTANLSFTEGAALSTDVDTLAEFNAVIATCGSPTTPIIFDMDGSLTTALGLPPEVIGFAGPVCVTTAAPFRITKGNAVLNGKFIDGNQANGEISQADFTATFAHEFGHMLNLDHTQVNGHYFLGDTDDPGFVAYGAPPVASIQLMFPLLVEGAATVPLADDIAAISTLYPSPSFSSKGTITGTIFQPDGTTLFQGANVIARNVAKPFTDAVSNVSGTRYCQPGRDELEGGGTCVLVSGSAPPELKGLYEINGLTPGASYTVEIVNVNPEFTNGSSVGPFLVPVVIPGPEEFYNGADETSTDPPDDPTTSTPVTVASTITDIDIVINTDDQPPTLDPIGDQSVQEGAARNVNLSATDPDNGDSLSFSITDAPDFATLTDHGDGTATLHLSPTKTDAGTYGGVVITVSDGILSDSETITIVVTQAAAGGGGGGGGCGAVDPIERDAEPPGTALGLIAAVYLPLLILFLCRRLRNRISPRPS